MTEHMFDFTPRTFRILAGILYAVAIVSLATVALGVLQLAITGSGPDWNIAERFSETGAWFYVGALHSIIARLKERKGATR